MKKRINMLFCIMLLFLIEGCVKEETEPIEQQQKLQQQSATDENIAPSVFKEEKIFGTYEIGRASCRERVYENV